MNVAGLGAALVRRGDQVVLADVDGDAATAVAERLTSEGPGTASALPVDVRDAAAVAAVVAETVPRHVIVNNAGIGIGGNVEELAVGHWDRAIDVNLRGVVHGTGRVPVVGLSLSLRGEGAGRGVRVSVVCPGGVDTPILDKRTPADLPPVPSADNTDSRALITKMSGGWLYDADGLAADVLRGIDRNRAIIVAPRQARVLWRLMRLSPSLFLRLYTAIAGRSLPTGTSPVELVGTQDARPSSTLH